MKTTLFKYPPLIVKIKSAIIIRSDVKLFMRKDEFSLFGGKNMRVNITLACTETGERNYISTKNKRTNPERLELMKYCPRLKKHTLHRETK